MSRAQSPSPQEADKYPKSSFMLQWISCKLCTISSPGDFPITLCFATLRVFWQTLALVTIVTAVPTRMLQGCPFHAKSVAYKSFPFRLELPRHKLRSELILLLPFLLQNISLDALFLWVRNSKPRLPGQGNCCSQHSRQCCKDAASWQWWWHLSCPLEQSSHPLTEREQSYVPALFYITCASCLQEWDRAPTTATPSLQHHICYIDKWASHSKLQPHAFKWLHLPPPLLWLKEK